MAYLYGGFINGRRRGTREEPLVSKRQILGLYTFCFFFFHAYFFYESQALLRQLCSGICYFLVTLLVLNMLFFGVFASNYAFFFAVLLCVVYVCVRVCCVLCAVFLFFCF